MSGCSLQVCSRNKPAIGLDRLPAAQQMIQGRDGGAVRVTSCIGCSSCCGSPISTSPAAAGETASTLASDICAASSTNSTSTAFRASGRAQSHAVPPATWQSPVSALKTSSFLVVNRSGPNHFPFRPVSVSRSDPFRSHRPHSPLRRAGAYHLVAVRRDADFRARVDQSADHPCAREGLAGARRPLDRQHSAFKKRRNP